MKIIINGISGRMGSEVARIAKEGYRGASIVCGIDPNSETYENGVPCFHSFSEAGSFNADCVIDFSHHSVTEALLEYCVDKNLPVVIATTGHDEKELEIIKRAS